MRKVNILILFLMGLLSEAVIAANGELAPRKGMGPLDQAKVHKVQAQKWSKMAVLEEIGSDMEAGSNNYSTTSGSNGNGIGRSKSCVTNVGNITTQKGASSGRYGPKNKNDNVVVIKGDVVNVCK